MRHNEANARLAIGQTLDVIGHYKALLAAREKRIEELETKYYRVVELYEGRVVRDEVSGGYTEESTTEFGLRMRAEMGVGPEGQTNGHDHESLL